MWASVYVGCSLRLFVGYPLSVCVGGSQSLCVGCLLRLRFVGSLTVSVGGLQIVCVVSYLGVYVGGLRCV